jgi:hypothetical protein
MLASDGDERIEEASDTGLCRDAREDAVRDGCAVRGSAGVCQSSSPCRRWSFSGIRASSGGTVTSLDFAGELHLALHHGAMDCGSVGTNANRLYDRSVGSIAPFVRDLDVPHDCWKAVIPADPVVRGKGQIVTGH